MQVTAQPSGWRKTEQVARSWDKRQGTRDGRKLGQCSKDYDRWQ